MASSTCAVSRDVLGKLQSLQLPAIEINMEIDIGEFRVVFNRMGKPKELLTVRGIAIREYSYDWQQKVSWVRDGERYFVRSPKDPTAILIYNHAEETVEQQIAQASISVTQDGAFAIISESGQADLWFPVGSIVANEREECNGELARN